MYCVNHVKAYLFQNCRLINVNLLRSQINYFQSCLNEMSKTCFASNKLNYKLHSCGKTHKMIHYPQMKIFAAKTKTHREYWMTLLALTYRGPINRGLSCACEHPFNTVDIPSNFVKRSDVTGNHFEWSMSLSLIPYCIRLLGENIADQGYSVSQNSILDSESILLRCRASIENDGPTLNQHGVIVSKKFHTAFL